MLPARWSVDLCEHLSNLPDIPSGWLVYVVTWGCLLADRFRLIKFSAIRISSFAYRYRLKQKKLIDEKVTKKKTFRRLTIRVKISGDGDGKIWYTYIRIEQTLQNIRVSGSYRDIDNVFRLHIFRDIIMDKKKNYYVLPYNTDRLITKMYISLNIFSPQSTSASIEKKKKKPFV